MSPTKIIRTFWVRYQAVVDWDDTEFWHITASVEYKPWYYIFTRKYKIKTITLGKYKMSRYNERAIMQKVNDFIPKSCDNQNGEFKHAITVLEK